MKQIRTRLLICAIAAAGFAYGTYLVERIPISDSLRGLVVALDYIQFPAFIAAAALSNNFHEPNNIIYCSLLFLTYFIAFVLCAMVITVLGSQSVKGRND